MEEEKRNKTIEDEMNKKKEQKEQMQRTINYTKEVHDKNMKKIGGQKSKTVNNEEKSDKNLKRFNDTNKVPSDTFIPKKRYLNETNNNISNKSNDNNNQKNSNLNLIPKETENQNLNNDVVDLRYNLEEQIIKEIENRNKIQNDIEINKEIDDKINTIKLFRNNGIIPTEEINIKKSDKNNKKEKKNKKFVSEFEKRRFNKALKNILTERLGEHHIYIQNICSCGNLKKQLTAIVEKGNLTVFALTEVECANNCIFYKNKKAYLKSINDVLKSIKNIAYENFHNKYKE